MLARMSYRSVGLGALAIGCLLGHPSISAAAPVAAPGAFGVAERETVLQVHAAGAQVYQCEAGPGVGAVWTFREPISTLIGDGSKTIGRHFAGPSWELDDGGAVKGKLLASAPGAGADDIPLLKLTVSERRGAGVLAGASLILRLNTHGGALKGPCPVAGELRAAPYSADYVFLR